MQGVLQAPLGVEVRSEWISESTTFRIGAGSYSIARFLLLLWQYYRLLEWRTMLVWNAVRFSHALSVLYEQVFYESALDSLHVSVSY